MDLNANRTHRLNVAREISQKLNLNYIFGREFQELAQGSRSSPAYHGQATLSPWPLSNPRILRFRRQSNFWRPRWFLPEIEPLQERIGGRIALISEVSIGGRILVTYNLHLESRGDDALRCSQLNETKRFSPLQSDNTDRARWRPQPRHFPKCCCQLAHESTVSQYRLDRTRANDTFAFAVRQRAAHRLDIRPRIDSSCTLTNSQLGFSIGPLSVVSKACFHVTTESKPRTDECRN